MPVGPMLEELESSSYHEGIPVRMPPVVVHRGKKRALLIHGWRRIIALL